MTESIENLINTLKTSKEKGLSSEEAKARISQYGENKLEEKKKSMLATLFGFFWGPIPWMIEIAAILSGYLQRWPDFYMIVALLLINATLGFWQEFKASNAIEALKGQLALKAHVLRDGKWQEIEAKFLVPGDIVLLKLGNIVPADITLISGEYLSVDQSALTGESLPVDRKVGDEIYSGSISKLGEMNGVVTKTGMNTFFGQTAKLVQSAKTTSHFQQAVMRIGRFLIYATLAIAMVIFVVSLYRIEVDKDLHESFGQILIFLLVLVIAGIPVAMPAVLSMSMAIGANKMAKMKAIVAKLIAIEELAGMDILCTDKTGTLTKNQLTVGDVSPYGDAKPEEVLEIAALASKQDQGDAIDNAIFSKVDSNRLQQFSAEKFTPFDPVRKRAEAVIQGPNQEKFTVAKGAPQVIIDLAKLSEDEKGKVNQIIDGFGTKGYRTLGVARGDTAGKWQFVGLIPLFDPPREDTKETIDEVKSMGIQVKMVTGDHTAIAKQVAGQIGLGDTIYSASKIFQQEKKEAGSSEELDEELMKADGFSEVFPEHKFQIVKHIQSKKHYVGMTGDGVNDAPALKQADVGIAVSNATDAARAAADLILTQPGLLVIKNAIEEARCIFGRMKSYAMYRISETCRLLLFLFLAMLVFNTHPLSAVMIILIALLNDIPIMTVAYDNMPISKEPVSWDMKEVLNIAVGLSVVGVVSTFGLYWIGQSIWHLSTEENRTLAFMAILCGGNLTIYLTRNAGALWERPFPNMKFFIATLFSQVVGTVVSVYGLGSDAFVGIGWKYVGYSWIYIAIWFVICLLTKVGIYHLLRLKAKSHAQFIKSTSEHLGKK